MISLAIIVLGGLGTYVKIESQLQVQAEISLQLGRETERMKTDSAQREIRLRSLELMQGRIDEKLINITATLQEIKAVLQKGESR